jgi:hypothetical protein
LLLHTYVLERVIWYDGCLKGDIWWGRMIAWFPHVSLKASSPPATSNRIS